MDLKCQNDALFPVAMLFAVKPRDYDRRLGQSSDYNFVLNESLVGLVSGAIIPVRRAKCLTYSLALQKN
jgi:hypothetical protein